MFESLSRTERPRGRRPAFAAAVIAHAVLVAGVGVSSLLALEPIAPPQPPPTVYVHSVPIDLGAASGGGGAPAAKPAAPTTRPESKPRRKLVQPTEVAPVTPVKVDEETPVDPAELASIAPPIDGTLPGEDPGAAGPGKGDGRDEGDGTATRKDASAEGPIRLSAGVRPPEVIHQVQPRYPEVDKALKREGTVVLEAVIDRHGNVADVKVLKGIPSLAAAAVEAARQWRFRPALLDGRPVDVYFTLTVTFRLR